MNRTQETTLQESPRCTTLLQAECKPGLPVSGTLRAEAHFLCWPHSCMNGISHIHKNILFCLLIISNYRCHQAPRDQRTTLHSRRAWSGHARPGVTENLTCSSPGDTRLFLFHSWTWASCITKGTGYCHFPGSPAVHALGLDPLLWFVWFLSNCPGKPHSREREQQYWMLTHGGSPSQGRLLPSSLVHVWGACRPGLGRSGVLLSPLAWAGSALASLGCCREP